MTRQQLQKKMRPVLLRRRDALRRSLAGELGQFNTTPDPLVGDEADRAVDADYGFVNSHLAEAESRELEQIEYALEQIRAGRYGICEMCDGKIALARLRALPYATSCIRCQREAEQGDDATGRRNSGWTPSRGGHASGRMPPLASLIP